MTTASTSFAMAEAREVGYAHHAGDDLDRFQHWLRATHVGPPSHNNDIIEHAYDPHRPAHPGPWHTRLRKIAGRCEAWQMMRWRRGAPRRSQPVDPDPVSDGQESVWDYPRPPRAERGRRRVRIVHRNTLVLDTDDVVRVLETAHPPTYYLPRSEFRVPLGTAARLTSCEFKGEARYVDVLVPDADPLVEVGWWYPEPDLRYPQLLDRVAVYPGPFDEVTVDGERVTSQPGDFYGGWITSDVVGPFKGGAGSLGW